MPFAFSVRDYYHCDCQIIEYSYKWFRVLVWGLLCIITWKSGINAIYSMEQEKQDGMLDIAYSTPRHWVWPLIAKYLGVLLPIWTELAILSLISFIIFGFFGSWSYLVYMVMAMMFLGGVALISASVGFLLNELSVSHLRALKMYKALVSALLVIAICYMVGYGLGLISSLIFITYILLFCVPELNRKFTNKAGLLAIVMMISLPVANIFSITRSIYDFAMCCNPFVFVWKYGLANLPHGYIEDNCVALVYHASNVLTIYYPYQFSLLLLELTIFIILFLSLCKRTKSYMSSISH